MPKAWMHKAPSEGSCSWGIPTTVMAWLTLPMSTAELNG
jgi:hypothetical protein